MNRLRFGALGCVLLAVGPLAADSCSGGKSPSPAPDKGGKPIAVRVVEGDSCMMPDRVQTGVGRDGKEYLLVCRHGTWRRVGT